MAMHFTTAELEGRREALTGRMRAAGLDGLLMFRQESMFWLTGYDTFGYVFFQCLVLTADGRVALITRAPDLRQAQNTSNIEDIRIWVDRDDASPADALRDLLGELGLSGTRLGVEYEAYGLTGRNALRLNTALRGFASLDDCSEMVSELRLVKSPAEIEYVRRAARLADDALEAAWELAHPGADEAEILAAMQSAVFRGGGDYPGNEFVIGSGPDALLCRYFSGRRKLDPEDQLTLEFAGVYHHYHSAMMRTIPIGRALPEHLVMHAVCAAALSACAEALVPGYTLGEVFDAHARVMDERGFAHARLNACGYSLGTTFAPNWMDWPMLYHGNSVVLAAGQVFFMHMILMDSDKGQAMTLGETFLVTEAGNERLGRLSMDLITG
jgi:Xaa-Pro dipeptidase